MRLELREQGEWEGDEAMRAAEIGTPGENLGFHCKRDGKPLQDWAGEGHELTLFTQRFPLSHTPISLLMEVLISPLLPVYLCRLLPSLACLHACSLAEVIIFTWMTEWPPTSLWAFPQPALTLVTGASHLHL